MWWPKRWEVERVGITRVGKKAEKQVDKLEF